MNVLFYSEKCKYSNSVILSLKNEGLINYFKLICLDNPLEREKVTGLLQGVPSMMVVGRTDVLTLTDIFKWIESQRFISRNQDLNRKSNSMQIAQNTRASNIDKINELKNKLNTNNFSTVPTNQNPEVKPNQNPEVKSNSEDKSKDFIAFDPYNRTVQLTPIEKEEGNNNLYCNINESNINKLYTAEEEKKLSSRRHEKLVEEFKNMRKMQNIERNFQNKKPKTEIDFTKQGPKDELVHKGYYTEIVNDLTKSSR